MRTLSTLCVMAGVALAQRPSPAPPSTGREMPQSEKKALSREMQLQLLQRGITEFGRGGDCTVVYNVLTLGILGGTEPLALDTQSQPAWTALAVCASRTEHHMTALRVAVELFKADPKTPWAWLVPESEI